MPDQKWLARALAVLAGWQTGDGNAWRDDRHVGPYTLVLRRMGEQMTRAAMDHAILRNTWRPSPAELARIGVTLSCDAPSAGPAFDEFWCSVAAAVRTPIWSHPLIAEIPAALGSADWAYWRTLRPHLADRDLRSIYWTRFVPIWTELTNAWRDDAIDALGRPETEWAPRILAANPTLHARTQPAIQGATE
jgi:hypothetical protein